MRWLLSEAVRMIHALDNCAIVETWTGFRPISEDGLPLIGEAEPKGCYFLTGHGPSGIAPLPGSIGLLMACIFGEEPPVPAEPFDPKRFLVSAA